MNCFCGKARQINCVIVFLDDHSIEHVLEDTASGQQLLDVAFQHLNLMEVAYFGLRYLDHANQTHWLATVKSLRKQLNWMRADGEPLDAMPIPSYTLYFGVKFYAVDPCKLVEELTRFQFFLQVKQDILQGRVPVPFELAAELGGYIVQSELGNFDERIHKPNYLSEFRFLHNQTVELETRVAEFHKQNIGLSPCAAELKYLDKVKWLELYGVDLHSVLGEDNVEYFLGLTPSGIVVLRNKAIVGNYYWPRITKIYFKSRYFMLRVADKNNDESTFGFETPSKASCKHLWKCCLEHHAFFRLYQVSPGTAAHIFGLSSRFRFSGKTEKQARQEAKKFVRNPPMFFRSSASHRIVEGALSPCQNVDEKTEWSGNREAEIKMVSIPQAVQNPYRSMTDVRRDSQNDSPKSTRSASWAQLHSQKGLYGSNNASNQRSTSPQSMHSQRSQASRRHHRHRSPSADSHSSVDSRTFRKQHRHRNHHHNSDNDSEVSKCSSAKSHRRHRRSSSQTKRHRAISDVDITRMYDDVDNDVSPSRRRRSSTGHSGHSSRRRRRERDDRRVDSGSESSFKHATAREHRKHRGNSPAWMPDELKQHLEFNLVETAGMTASQLQQIPYTIVNTSQNNTFKHHVATKKGKLSSILLREQAQRHSKANAHQSNASYDNSSVDGTTIHHEHTDSGLGAEQDYDDRSAQTNVNAPPTTSLNATTRAMRNVNVLPHSSPNASMLTTLTSQSSAVQNQSSITDQMTSLNINHRDIASSYRYATNRNRISGVTNVANDYMTPMTGAPRHVSKMLSNDALTQSYESIHASRQSREAALYNSGSPAHSNHALIKRLNHTNHSHSLDRERAAAAKAATLALLNLSGSLNRAYVRQTGPLLLHSHVYNAFGAVPSLIDHVSSTVEPTAIYVDDVQTSQMSTEL